MKSTAKTTALIAKVATIAAVTLMLSQPALAENHHDRNFNQAERAAALSQRNLAFQSARAERPAFNSGARFFGRPLVANNSIPTPITSPVLNNQLAREEHKAERHNRQRPFANPLVNPALNLNQSYLNYNYNNNYAGNRNWLRANRSAYIPANYYRGIPQSFYVNGNLVSTSDIDSQKVSLATSIQAAAAQRRIPTAEASQLAMMLNQLNVDESNYLANDGGAGVTIADHSALLSELSTIATAFNGYGGYNIAINPWVL